MSAFESVSAPVGEPGPSTAIDAEERRPQADGPSRSAPAQQPRRRASVLIVDDRPENLLALEAILEPLDLNVVKASGGEEALKQVLTDDFAVILLDVQMPGVDGFETAEYMKRLERTRHVPIIFLTAISKDSSQVFRGYEAGAVDYLFKPFEPTILRSKVSVFVELYEKRTALRLAELEQEHAARLRMLADASLAIASARSLGAIARLTADRAREILGSERSWAYIAPPEGGDDGHEAVSPATADPGAPRNGRGSAAAGLSELVSRTNEPLSLSAAEVDMDPAWAALEEEPRGADDWLEATAPGGEPPAGLLAVPLVASDGSNLGVIEVTGKAAGEFGGDDKSVLTQLAQTAASAIENVRLYEHEHGIAETLQRSLLPQRLPRVPGALVEARYVAGGSGLEVGGDWYDVVPLEDGRVALTLGDVVGRGIRAASVMGQLRVALRAYAVEGHSPGRVADRLNRLVHSLDIGHMTTFVFLVFDPRTNEVRFTCGGHPPPLMLDPDGRPAFLEGGRSLPLGVIADAAYDEQVAELPPGASLVLYTDGLVEERDSPIDAGLARLADAAAGEPVRLEGLCDRLLEQMGDDDRADDVALLALRALAPVEDLRLEVPAEPAELASVREALREWLRGAGALLEETSQIVLACAEAWTNAIEHARAKRQTFEVHATLEDDEVTISIRDFGTWRPPHDEPDRGRGLLMMGMLMDAVDVDRTPDGTHVRLRRRLGR